MFMSAGLCDVSGKSQSVICLMDALGSVNSGSPHRSNVTFSAEKIFLVCVKDLGERLLENYDRMVKEQERLNKPYLCQNTLH